MIIHSNRQRYVNLHFFFYTVKPIEFLFSGDESFAGKIDDHRRWQSAFQSQFVCVRQSVLVDFGHMEWTTMDTGHEFAIGGGIYAITDEQGAILQRARLHQEREIGAIVTKLFR